MRSILPLSFFAAGALVAGCASTPPPPPSQPVTSYETKLGWILRLEDQRILREAPPALPPPAPASKGRVALPAPVPQVADLTALLSDTDPRIRRRAALAIGRVGLPDGMEPLRAALAEQDPDVRLMVVFALGLLADARAAESLLPLLEAPDPRLQGRVAEALGRLRPTPAEAGAAIGQMVARHAVDPAVTALAVDDLRYPLAPAAEAFRLGLYALVQLKAWDPLAAAVLDAHGAPRVRWWPVAYALQRIEDSRAVPALLNFARGTGVDAVGFAARGLGVLKEVRGIDVLVPLLEPTKQDHRLVAAAARALGQIGHERAIEPLLRLLRTPALDTATLREVVDALGALRAHPAVDDFLDLMGHPDPVIRGAAYGAVAAVDQDTFVRALSGLDPDEAWQVRSDLARALGGIERERALPRLLPLAADADQRVVAAALTALAAVKTPELPALLRARLGSDDVSVRATAATLIGELRPAEGEDWLRGAWERGRSDPSYVARAAALAGLARYGLAAADVTLRDALRDSEWPVRVRAAQLLRELDPQAEVDVIRPAPTRRTAAEYGATSLIAPSYSPHVYIDTAKGTIQLELFVLDAPLTADNFVALARRGFFDGLPVHRVVPNFVVQGGDPRGDGEGGPGYTIRDEINDRPYLRGSVGMALDGPDTGGSQFFITHGPQPHLEGRYTVFGAVVGGMELVDRLQPWDVIQRVRVWDGVQAPAN